MQPSTTNDTSNPRTPTPCHTATVSTPNTPSLGLSNPNYSATHESTPGKQTRNKQPKHSSSPSNTEATHDRLSGKSNNTKMNKTRKPTRETEQNQDQQIVPLTGYFSQYTLKAHQELKNNFRQKQQLHPQLQNLKMISAFKRKPSPQDLLVRSKFSSN